MLLCSRLSNIFMSFMYWDEMKATKDFLENLGIWVLLICHTSGSKLVPVWFCRKQMTSSVAVQKILVHVLLCRKQISFDVALQEIDYFLCGFAWNRLLPVCICRKQISSCVALHEKDYFQCGFAWNTLVPMWLHKID